MKNHGTMSTMPTQTASYSYGHVYGGIGGVNTNHSNSATTSTGMGNTHSASGARSSSTVREELDLTAVGMDPVVDLTAVGALDATSIAQIAELATTFIQISWQPPSLLSSKQGGNQARASFKNFCSDVLIRTGITGPIILVALWFLERLRRMNPNVRAAQGAEFRLFAVALMLANKIMDDHRLLLRCWSQVTGIQLSELNIMEIEFLTSLNYKLHMTELEYYQWANRISHELLRQQQRRIGRRVSRSSPLGNQNRSPAFSSSPSAAALIQHQPQYMPVPPSPALYGAGTHSLQVQSTSTQSQQRHLQTQVPYIASSSSTEKDVPLSLAALSNAIQPRRIASLSSKTVSAALKQRARIQPSTIASSFSVTDGNSNHNSLVIPSTVSNNNALQPLHQTPHHPTTIRAASSNNPATTNTFFSSVLTQKSTSQLPRNHIAYQQQQSTSTSSATSNSATSATYIARQSSPSIGGQSEAGNSNFRRNYMGILPVGIKKNEEFT